MTKYLISLFMLLGCENKKPVEHQKKTGQESIIILDSTSGNTISVTQSNGTSVVEINGKKYINGKKVK